MMNTEALHGVFPPIFTPFKENGDVDYRSFVSNIGKWNDTALRGYVVLGSNGETAYLSGKEKLELVRLAVEHRAGDKTVIVGTGLESTRETIRLTEDVAAIGADAALVLTPSFYRSRMDDRALIAHYSTVANNARIPVLLYNVPKFTGLNVSADLVREVSAHPNITGMKDSSGNVAQLVEFQSVADAEFAIMVGTASVWFPALCLGVGGGVLALANIAPDECVEIQRLYESGNTQAAEEIYRRLLPVNTAITAIYGPAGLKYAAGLLGYAAGTVRQPLSPLTETEKDELRAALVRAGLLS